MRRLLLLSASLLASSVLRATPPASPAGEAGSINALQVPMAELRASAEKGILAWLAKAAHPLPEASPPAEALAPLVRTLGTPRVIGIGELTHGTHEDLAFKAALIRALVERGGIDTLAFEVHRTTGERLDRFVAPGSRESDAAAAMKDARVYSIWMTSELAGLLDWLRAWNARAATPVRIIGIDVQDASRDFADALAALERIDPAAATGLRDRLADWISPEALGRHQTMTLKAFDRPRWQRSLDAARALEAALTGRDAAGASAAGAARAAIEMLEYDVPGMAATLLDTPDEAYSRRDVAMAERLVAAVPAGRRAVLWAHDSHVVRANAPHGFGYTTTGAQLHRLLGVADYRVVTFSARDIEFNAKAVADGRVADRGTPFSRWRYVARPEDLGSFLARTGTPRFWVDLGAIPAGEAGLVFRILSYGRPSFGWNVTSPVYPFVPMPVGFGSDVLVHFDRMTPSHRLP